MAATPSLLLAAWLFPILLGAPAATAAWHLETEAPGNDLAGPMEARGLFARGTGPSAPVNREARALVVEAILSRVRDVYRRFPLAFFVEAPDPRRFPLGPGLDHSRICVGGGRARRCGGTLGAQFYDPGNRFAEWQCVPGRLGVFANRICGLRSDLSPPLRRSDLRFVDGTYRVGAGSDADDDRFIAVRLALDDWGTALGNVTAHEIGHALGLAHDRRRGHIMQARFSDDDLSDAKLALSPASRRTLGRDVGTACRPGTAWACAHEADATLDALARAAEAVVVLGPSGEPMEVLKGGPHAPAERARALPGAEAGPGIAFLAADGEGAFVGAAHERERRALRDYVAGSLAGGGRRRLVEALGHWHERIASDAAIELRRAAGPPEPGEAERIEEALARNAASFDDLRPLIRVAGRAGAARTIERIIDLVAAPPEGPDLARAGAEALAALGGCGALRDRLAGAAAGPERSRLAAALLAIPETPPVEREALLADADPAVARAAAMALLLGGPEGRRRLLARVRAEDPEERGPIAALVRRPSSGTLKACE